MQKEEIGFIADYGEDCYGLQGIKMYDKFWVMDIGYNNDFEDEFQDDPNYSIYSPDLEEIMILPIPKYLNDDMDLDPDLYDLPDDYNDDNMHPVFMLKD